MIDDFFKQILLSWTLKTAWRRTLDVSLGLANSPCRKARVTPHPATNPFVPGIAKSPSCFSGKHTVRTNAVSLTCVRSLTRAKSASTEEKCLYCWWINIFSGITSCCEISFLLLLWSPTLTRYLENELKYSKSEFAELECKTLFKSRHTSKFNQRLEIRRFFTNFIDWVLADEITRSQRPQNKRFPQQVYWVRFDNKYTEQQWRHNWINILPWKRGLGNVLALRIELMTDRFMQRAFR